MPLRKKATNSLIWLGLLAPLALYGTNIARRPHLDELAPQPLFQGITYSRRVQQQPRPQILHIIEIDLAAPGIEPLVTPGAPDTVANNSSTTLTQAQKTSEFVESQGVQLAVNGNFFYPFREVTPWNFYPHSGNRVNSVGIAVSDGNLVSEQLKKWPSLCFRSDWAEIRADGTCKDGLQAVAGKTLMLSNGKPTEDVKQQIAEKTPKPYPFNIAALDATGTRLWLILADGKQPLYAEGITLEESVELLQELKVDTALRLDGGGSTTVAMATDTGARILNIPIHTKIPGRQRPVANNLGFFANPLTP
ncbi:MAG: phosphodiester glycosidase family protein [Cyanobacteria bacterium P01_D01_bin.156]